MKRCDREGKEEWHWQQRERRQARKLSSPTSIIQATCSSVEAGANGKKEDESRKYRGRRRVNVAFFLLSHLSVAPPFPPPHCQRRFFPSITSQCCSSIPSTLIVNVASFYLPSHLIVASPFPPPSLSTSLLLSLHHISVMLLHSLTLIVNVLLLSFHHTSVLLLRSLIVNVTSPFSPSHLSVAPPFPPPSLSTSLLFLHHISVLLLHSLPLHCQCRFIFSFHHTSVCFSVPSPLIVNVASPFPPSHLSVAPPFPPPHCQCRSPFPPSHLSVASPFPPPSLSTSPLLSLY